MRQLLEQPPFAPRDEATLLEEMDRVTRWHLEGCAEYRRVWPNWSHADSLEQLPYLHAAIFKHVLFKTQGEGIAHQRTLTSSATSGAAPSRIVLDRRSSELQSRSSAAILREMVGPQVRPLIVLEGAQAVRQDEVMARVAAAMSLRPLAAELHFVLRDVRDPASMNWEEVGEVFRRHDDVLVYGFTWILWQAWAAAAIPAEVRTAMQGKRVHFVHSGGWKRLEQGRVDRARFDASLLEGLSPASRVIDYYGLVEQVGVIYPLCEHGYRHAPRWSGVMVRNAWDLRPVVGEEGLLQLLNPLAWGAPYHSVLTEDMGRLVPGDCPCGRAGTRFELLGRSPNVEVRGCANV